MPAKSATYSRPSAIATVDIDRPILSYAHTCFPVAASTQFRHPTPSPASGTCPTAAYTRLLKNTGVAITSLGPFDEPYLIGFPSGRVLYLGGLQSYDQSIFSGRSQ